MNKGRVAELRKALETKSAFIQEGVAKGVKIDGSNVEIKTEDWTALLEAKAEAEQIQTLIAMELFGDQVKSFFSGGLTGPGAESVALQVMGGDSPFHLNQKSIGEMFTASEEFKDLLTQGGSTMRTPFAVELHDLPSAGWGRKDVYTTSAPVQSTRGFGRTQFDPMVPRQQRVARVRDLFPIAATNANLIDYFKVTGFAENSGKGAAASVAERTGDNTNFALKPKSNLAFTSAQAPVRTIAHWEAAHRNVLEDEPQLQAVINNELLYGLALEEDRQILLGSGSNEELLGILNTSGIQPYVQANAANAATEPKSDALRRATTLAIIANYAPTGFVLHPYDWEDIELQKGTGDGQYMIVTNVAIGADQRIWRLPVIDTPAMPEGTFLTGAFGIGAQLYDRQQANIRIAEQHADFFVRNAVAILAEERLALAVKRPESFVKGTFFVPTP